MNLSLQARLYPTIEQSRLLMAHCYEYISTVNVLVAAIDSDILPENASTKDFTAALPSKVKNQALRDAHSVWKRSLELGVIPVLKKPICQWNNQCWYIEQNELKLPVYRNGEVEKIAIPCASIELEGKKGMLRIKKKRGKWIADITITLPDPQRAEAEGIMGVDLGIKVPAVAHVPGKRTRFFGNGRYQRMMRRRFYAERKALQRAGKVRAVRKRQGKEIRWMRNINHQLSRQVVNYARQQGVGVIRLEKLTGIRRGTTRKSRGAKARKNNRMMNTWSFYQLMTFISYKAERLGIRIELVDPADTSKACPVCQEKNTADDRTYICRSCGWMGHRDAVGAINISRRTGVHGHSVRATGARGSARGGLPETAHEL